MSTIAIRADSLAKQYRLGESTRYKALRDVLTDAFKSPFRRARSLFTAPEPECSGRARDAAGWMWALRDVSFEIQRGEVVGIIGHNGAGKSTLLKILSRVTAPTRGCAEIHGTMGSLLEVGTGFHPELSGRENIFLNGAILGLSRKAIASRLDEIVSFAELERFVDTPVKHYSSGMYVRLGFAVAAHLEPEILLVDEVLAVGDASFWSKCITKIKELIARDTTIFLVTHNMWLVQTLCSRAICMSQGAIAKDTSPLEAIGYYKGINPIETIQNTDKESVGTESRRARIIDLELKRKGIWQKPNVALSDSGVSLKIKAHLDNLNKAILMVRVTSHDGLPFFTVCSEPLNTMGQMTVASQVDIDSLMLQPGSYLLWGAICSDKGEDEILAADRIPFEVDGANGSTNRFSLFWNQGVWQYSLGSEGQNEQVIEDSHRIR